jgi:hypothetical protein
MSDSERYHLKITQSSLYRVGQHMPFLLKSRKGKMNNRQNEGLVKAHRDPDKLNFFVEN